MQLLSKSYKILKTKNYLKENDLFLFLNSISQNSCDEIIIEQNLKKINLKSYKIFNKTSKITIKNSLYQNSKELVNSITLFIKPVYNFIEFKKSNLFNNFELFLNMLAIKINSKIYSMNQLKEIISLNNRDINFLLLQSNTTSSKMFFK